MNAEHPSEPRAVTSGRLHRRIGVTALAAAGHLLLPACGSGSAATTNLGTAATGKSAVDNS